MEFKIQTKNIFKFKLIIIIISMFTPFLMLLYDNTIPSLSSYWRTSLQPLFIISNLLTCLMFITIPKWKLSGILLLTLTCFSIDYYSSFHNIVATLFFISNLYPLYSIKKYRILALVYFMGVLWYPSLIFFEIHGVVILCIYHLMVLISYNNIQNKRI